MLRFSQPARSSRRSYLPHGSEDSQGKEKHDAQLRANRLLICVVCIFLFIGPALIWTLFRNPSLSTLIADSNRSKSPFTSEKFRAQAPITVLPKIESASVDATDSNSNPGNTLSLSSAEWFREWTSLRTALTYLSEVISLSPAAPNAAANQATAASSQPISWVAGKPTFNRLFTRDIAFSFLLMFPLSSPDTSSSSHVWDLSDLYSASPKPFPFHRTFLPQSTPHPSVSASALSDMSRIRTALQLLAAHQGSRRSERNGGEEPGKIPHELPGVDIDTKIKMTKGTSPWRNTQYAASDSTAMWVISTIHYFHMSNDIVFLQKMIPHLVRSVQYIINHINKQGLFVEDPSKALNENVAAADATTALLALKVSYWKDSALAARWKQNRGSPHYPVAYLILQTQNIAALRAVTSLQKVLRHYATTGSSIFGEVSEQLTRGIATAASTDPQSSPAASPLDLDKLIPFMVSATRTFFFHAPATAADEVSTKYVWNYSPQFAETQFIVKPVNNPNPSPRCPEFGFDSQGSLSDVLVGGNKDDEMKQMITSDPLMSLYFLEKGDLQSEEIQQQFQSCFKSLETGIGYRTSNLPQLIDENPSPSSPSPLFDLTRSGKELLYHHASVWGVEQALIHSAAQRFELNHVVKQSRKYFRSMQVQRDIMHQQQKKKEPATEVSSSFSSDVIEDELVFPEFFLPTSLAIAARTGGADRVVLIGRGTARPATGDGKAVAQTGVAEQWIGQGTTVQLWSVAAWSYWLLHRSPSQQSSSSSQPPLQSPCAIAHSRIQRGVSSTNKFQYCPTTPTPTSQIIYPALIFTCLDGSQSLWLDQVDDDYCDCADGSDEMGTAACSHSDLDSPSLLPAHFICAEERGRFSPAVRRPRTIVFRSMVDDGVCDCCDGSDERDSGVQCSNVCLH